MAREPVNPSISLPELARSRRPPAELLVNDVSLREAEQSEGISLSQELKVELALALERCGVRQVQVGYPGRFERDRLATRAVREALSGTAVEVVALAFVEDWGAEIDACLDSGAEVISIVFRSSDRLQRLLGVDRQHAVECVRGSVERAVAGGALVAFLPSDTTRADPDHLSELWEAAAGAGARRVYVADSMGAGTPELIAWLVDRAHAVTGLPVGVHCHDDFGLAVANTLAGVNAGAEITDVAVNGLGDRAGNAPMEEVVAALELLYEQPTGVTLSSLTEISRRFARATGRELPPNKPISGGAAFVHTLPTHREAISRDSRSIQAFEPEIVGNVERQEDRPDS
jgi:isopropylmalate/homocitrate/citramalate synthase